MTLREMNMLKPFILLQHLMLRMQALDFMAPLALRLYLVPIFWMAGSHKLSDMESVIAWFGNTEWGLGLPMPTLMAWLAALTETAGAMMLLLGVAVRWISVPLMVTMVVAALSVHWQNGWLAIAEGADSLFANERTIAAVQRLDEARAVLKQHTDYAWLTEHGSLAILNNGVEFSVTYFIMLLVLFFIGAGRYVSLDYWFFQAFGRSSLGSR